MDKGQFRRQKFNNGVPVWFIAVCILNYNFRSFKRFLIYLFHFSGYIDLKVKDSGQYTDKELISILEPLFPNKILKKDICKSIDLSNPTFNKHFKKFFEENEFVGKRNFNLYQTYTILNEWQGNGQWGTLKSIKKEDLAKILHSGNYKKLADEFKAFQIEEIYDKNSPKTVKEFLKHIDIDNTYDLEKILGYNEFKLTLLITIIIKICSLQTTNN